MQDPIDVHKIVCLIDSSASTDRSPIRTRKINDRKPSKFKKSPFKEMSLSKKKQEFVVGPFITSQPVSDYELKLVNFEFDSALEKRLFFYLCYLLILMYIYYICFIAFFFF